MLPVPPGNSTGASSALFKSFEQDDPQARSPVAQDNFSVSGINCLQKTQAVWLGYRERKKKNSDNSNNGIENHQILLH